MSLFSFKALLVLTFIIIIITIFLYVPRKNKNNKMFFVPKNKESKSVIDLPDESHTPMTPTLISPLASESETQNSWGERGLSPSFHGPISSGSLDNIDDGFELGGEPIDKIISEPDNNAEEETQSEHLSTPSTVEAYEFSNEPINTETVGLLGIPRLINSSAETEKTKGEKAGSEQYLKDKETEFGNGVIERQDSTEEFTGVYTNTNEMLEGTGI